MRHPNVVPFVGFAKHQGTIWLVTRYVNGGNLRVFLKDQSNEVPWDVRLKLAREIAYASMYLFSLLSLSSSPNSNFFFFGNKVHYCAFLKRKTIKVPREIAYATLFLKWGAY